MSVRNREGFYRASALLDGYRDQYAVHRSYGLVKVELYADESGGYIWHVATIITNEGMSESTDTAFETLAEARQEFRRRVRKHP